MTVLHRRRRPFGSRSKLRARSFLCPKQIADLGVHLRTSRKMCAPIGRLILKREKNVFSGSQQFIERTGVAFDEGSEKTRGRERFPCEIPMKKRAHDRYSRRTRSWHRCLFCGAKRSAQPGV